MAHVPRDYIRLFGFTHQGDLGPLTTYTSYKGALVIFPRSSPLNPPSPQQNQMRNFFRLVAQSWRELPQEKRDAWQRLATDGGLRITAYNLYTWYQRTQDAAQIATIARQARCACPV
jgi:hypothetical protein